MTCIAVDDEPLALKLIESFARRTPDLDYRGSYTDSVEALSRLRDEPVDLVFLDIQMPDMNGMELSRMLPEPTRVIFTTAFKEYALESYDVATVDYLLKPVRYDKFLRAVEKARKWFERPAAPTSEPDGPAPDGLFLKTDGAIRKIDLDSIVYVEGMKDYVRFFLDGERPVVAHLTMKSVEQSLPADRFMRVSRSHIVALGRIRSVDRSMCLYVADTVIKVTDLYRAGFEAYLNRRLAK